MPRIDVELLSRFESGLDPRHPEAGAIPARVLGYGEISTVFEIDAPEASGWAFKRMPMFRDQHEADAYTDLYRRYIATLADQVGLSLPESQLVCVSRPGKGYVALYIAQKKLAPEAIAHRAIRRLSPDDVMRLVSAALREMGKVFAFNARNQGGVELALDPQISNWCIAPPFPSGGLGDPINLIYLDTSTPLMRVDGKEQLNPELLLRSAPPFLVWLVRRAFVPEVLNRYYSFRTSAIDLVANFYKEGRPDLIPPLVETVNQFFAEDAGGNARPLTVKEIEDYYRFDALIWRVYLALRKLDRSLARVSRREYPYILPGKITR